MTKEMAAKEYEQFQNEFKAFTLFDSEIKDVHNKLGEILLAEDKNQEVQKLFIENSSVFFNLTRIQERKLTFGYESLILCSFILIFLSVIILINKNHIQQKEFLKNSAIDEAHISFSRELHDGAAQDIAALKLYLNQQDIEKSTFYAEQAFNEIRYLIDTLHIDMKGSFETVAEKMLINFEKNFGVRTDMLFSSKKFSELQSEIQLDFIRILQESLSNIAKHSKATEMSLKIIDTPQSILFTISDNGIGINRTKAGDEKNHYGLQNIQERVKKINGKVDIISEGGTKIVITI